jgi:hypothetical protein
VHHNLVFNNRCAGFFFSRWGEDLTRKDVHVYNNTFYRNGYNNTQNGDPNWWLMGGFYLFTTNMEDVYIRNNILSLDYPFELGKSQDYLEGDLEAKNIVLEYNLIHDAGTMSSPFYMASWAKDSVYSITGDHPIEADPLFADPSAQDFRLQAASPAIDKGHPEAGFNDPDGTRNDIGAFPSGYSGNYFWWKTDFPPKIDDIAAYSESDFR